MRDITAAAVPATSDGPAILIDTSKLLCFKDHIVRHSRTPAPFYDHPLKRSHPLVLMAMFLALVLQLLGGVARDMCNFTLRVLRVSTQTAFALRGPLDPLEQKILDDMPTNIRTVRAMFGLDPVVTDYATCPKCSMTYAPTFSPTAPKVPIYPNRCTHRRFSNRPPCHARVQKSAVMIQRSIRVPIRPLPVQDFDTFVGRMLSVPGVEEAIRSTLTIVATGALDDIARHSRGSRAVEAKDAYCKRQ